MIKDEQIKKIWELVIKMNKTFIQSKASFTPVCFIIHEDYSLGINMMIFNDSKSKEKVKQQIKKLIVSQRIKGYILCMDAKLTTMKTEKNKVESVSDALVHNLFTPKEKICHVIIYDKDKKFTDEYEKDEGELVSDWDIWNYQERDENEKKMTKDYLDYKSKNPDKFEGTF
jgi:hypothetical protein